MALPESDFTAKMLLENLPAGQDIFYCVRFREPVAYRHLPPSAGMQIFGHVRTDGATEKMTVTLRDRANVALWSTTLDPKPI